MSDLLRALTTGVTAVPRLMGPAPEFYSRLMRSAEMLPERMKAESLINAIRRYPEGVANQEIVWSGLPEFASERAGKYVNKPELLQYLEGNLPNIYVRRHGYDSNVGRYGRHSGPAWAQYVMKPGDEHYSEALFENVSPVWLQREKKFGSPHWFEDNIELHTRTTDRDLESVGRTKFIDELQSDWHQAGREQGYAEPKSKLALKKANDDLKKAAEDEAAIWVRGMMYPDASDSVAAREADRAAALVAREAAIEDIRRISRHVPVSPFQDEWANVGLKDALHRAAMQGSPGIAWTRGKDISAVVGGAETGQSAFYDKQIGERLAKLLRSKGEVDPVVAKMRMTKTFAPIPEDVLGWGDVFSMFDRDRLSAWADRLGTSDEVLGHAVRGGNTNNLMNAMSTRNANSLYRFIDSVGGNKHEILSALMNEIRKDITRSGGSAAKAVAHYLPLSAQSRKRIVNEGFPLL